MYLKIDKFLFVFYALIMMCVSFSVEGNDKSSEIKNEAIRIVEMHKDELVALSDQIWVYAETALLEYQSSKVLSDYAELQGFHVEKGIAVLPSAFIAY